MSKVIENVKMPTAIMTHNKTLFQSLKVFRATIVIYKDKDDIMKYLKTVTLAVGAVCLLGSLAFGAGLSERGPISFDIYDTDENGYVSEKEFYDARAKRMTIRAEQGMPMRNAGNAPEFGQFDTNKDGKLSKTELLEGQNAQMQNKRSNRGQKGQGRGQR